MTVVEGVRDKRRQELVEGFFAGAPAWRREHGRMHTAVIIRDDDAGLETECEAYRLAAETLQERGYRVKYNKQLTLETGDFKYYRVGIYLEF